MPQKAHAAIAGIETDNGGSLLKLAARGRKGQ
jgi:hypothetical protein